MTEPTHDKRVELALDLPTYLEADELSLAEVVDRTETVTTDPMLTRDIFDAAEPRSIIEREGGRIRHNRDGMFVWFESQVVQCEGDFDCRRCGASISTGRFARFNSGEPGPFGSSCVRKTLGREQVAAVVAGRATASPPVAEFFDELFN